MTDRELMQQALNALETLLGWQSLAPHEDQEDAKAAAFQLRARLAQCTRCGKVNPAEIHTCTPKQAEPGAVDSDKVICPSCCHQFRAIPVNVQQLMLAAGFEPPFTSPQQRKPLTDEQIETIAIDVLGYGALRKEDMELFLQTVRAIETAHSIGGNNA